MGIKKLLVLEFFKLMFKIRQLSLNSLRNIFDFKSQNEREKMTKTQMMPIPADLKEILSDEMYKIEFSKSLLPARVTVAKL